MLKNIFGSGARVKLFRQFLLNPNDEFFIRELTRILDEQINSLRRELGNLEKIGLLKSSERNRKKYYKVNHHFPILNELTSIFRKNNDQNKNLLKNFAKLGDIEILILAGKFINNEKSTADIFVVGDVKNKDLEVFIKDNFDNAPLKYTIMNKDDFLYRITLKDKFIREMFEEKHNIILKNKLKKETLIFM